MRVCFVLLLSVMFLAGPALGQEDEPETLRTPEPTDVVLTPPAFNLNLAATFVPEQRQFEPLAAWSLQSEREYRAALWNAPLGRVTYQLSAEDAMLGRTGLVHGGRMIGLGMSATAIGGAPSSGLHLMMDGAKWSELSNGERFRVGFDVAITGGIIWALIEGLTDEPRRDNYYPPPPRDFQTP